MSEFSTGPTTEEDLARADQERKDAIAKLATDTGKNPEDIKYTVLPPEPVEYNEEIGKNPAKHDYITPDGHIGTTTKNFENED